MQKILQLKLKILAKLYLRRFKPTIIAVTGNAGKSSAKEAIGVVVGAIGRTRVAGGNLNNEIGVPLAILGDWGSEYYEQGSSLWFWAKVLLTGYWNLLFSFNYPKFLVLEYGADHPGDIKRLAGSYPPHVSIVTTVGDVPVHIEFFKNAEAVAAEKSQLVRRLVSSDFAVLNHDDERVLEMRSATKARVMTYGFHEHANICVSDFGYRSTDDGIPVGTTFKLHHSGSFIPVNIDGSLGRSQAWSAAAAAAVGLAMGLNLVQISQALTRYHGPKGRLKILPGAQDTVLIDDTYNASPASTRLALETLQDLPARRRVAILGDMLELGEHTIKAHQDIGSYAAGFVDLLVCVGSRARFICEEARKLMPPENIKTFETSDEAKQAIFSLIKPHDLILVKGSQGIRMEKIVATLLADPSRAKDLLARQSKKWLNKS